MNYQEMMDRNAEELGEFKIFYAFSNKQLKEGLAKFGLTEEEGSMQLYKTPGGGFIFRTDANKWESMFVRWDKELIESMKGEDFAINALIYELKNHEYCYTGETEEALRSLGLTLEKINESPMLQKALTAAIQICRDEDNY